MKDLLSRQAAIVLGVSYPTVKLRIYKHKLRAAQTPGDYRIPQSEIDKFLPKKTFQDWHNATHQLLAHQRAQSAGWANCGYEDQRLVSAGDFVIWWPAHYVHYHCRCCARDATEER